MNRISFFAVCLLFLWGCGGGTSGSGIKNYEGRISTTDGNTLSNATVTIESTGDSAVTNQSGFFAIQSEVEGTDIPFLIETENLFIRFSVKNTSELSTRVQLELLVDTKKSSVQAKELELDAYFTGLCDYYFENSDVIRQSNNVPPETLCSLNVSLRGDGSLLANTPVALQYAGCPAESEWQILKVVSTGIGQHSGYAEINFKFIDSAQFCRYRVIAPYGLKNSQQVTYPIDTFTEQEYYGK